MDNVFLPDVDLTKILLKQEKRLMYLFIECFVTAGDKAYLIENKALNENSMII